MNRFRTAQFAAICAVVVVSAGYVSAQNTGRAQRESVPPARHLVYIATPGDNGTGTLLQGYLEGSNVDPVKELVTLIKTQRAFELNSQSIQTADQALQTVAQLRRF